MAVDGSETVKIFPENEWLNDGRGSTAPPPEIAGQEKSPRPEAPAPAQWSSLVQIAPQCASVVPRAFFFFLMPHNILFRRPPAGNAIFPQ